jgi:hypothetical protein
MRTWRRRKGFAVIPKLQDSLLGVQRFHFDPDLADRIEGNTVFDSLLTRGLFAASQFKGSTPVTRAHGALSKE